ncbi:MAG: ParB N-terminal domain-containing protein [Ignisphaera sp.]
MKSELKKIKVSEIRIPEERLRAIQDTQSSTSFKASVKKYGILQPIIVRRTVTGYELIAGESRVKYAMENNIDEIEARVFDEIDDLDAQIISIVENVARGRLDLQAFISTIEQLSEKGYDLTEIAELLGYDKSYVSRFLKLREQPKELKQAVISGIIDINVAHEISMIKDENRKYDTLQTVLTMASASTRDELISFIRHYGRRKCDECGKENVNLNIVGERWLCNECTPKTEEGEAVRKEIYLDRLQCFMGMHEVERSYTHTVFICRNCLERIEYFRNIIKAVLGKKWYEIPSELLDEMLALMLEAREKTRKASLGNK